MSKSNILYMHKLNGTNFKLYQIQALLKEKCLLDIITGVEDDEFYESGSEENKIELWDIHDEHFDSENSDNKIIKEENVQEFSESEFENILNLCKRRCARMLSSSEDENESILQDHQNEIAADGNS
ncbi:DNA polymerase epsilon subunit 2-like [Vespula maculifrons]|uniref:Uncharacterized protein n=2 Tax=Vespula TaxID=7451 RepID=A0A834J413_VESVU|nr:hypothetical protein HZH66_013985 [Vespula vulgaris]